MKEGTPKVFHGLSFSLRQLQAFAAVSNDYNRLHIDAKYASRTLFGEQVVFGIALLLKALVVIRQEAGFSHASRLKAVRADFKKGLLLSDVFDLDCYRPDENSVVCVVRRFGDQVARFNYVFHDIVTDDSLDKGSLIVETAIHDKLLKFAEVYRCGGGNEESEAFASFCEKFGWSELPLDVGQLRFLLWSSYFVGMKYPGEQALYTSLKVEFPDGPCSSLSILSIDEDPRFSIARIAGRLGFVGNFQISALERPLPVEFPLRAIRDVISSAPFFADGDRRLGMRAMVTGGSRGFGSVLARALAVSGMDVDFSYIKNDEAAESVYADIESCGQVSKMYRADLRCANQSAALFHELGCYDIIFLNAMPIISKHAFVDYDAAQWVARIAQDISVVANPLKHALGLLAPLGKIVFISTEFIAAPEAGFSAYVAAKSAIEGGLSVLAQEHPELSFYSFRLPRMLTDQTNNPLFIGSLASPLEVCSEMLQIIHDDWISERGRGLAVFNLTGKPSR